MERAGCDDGGVSIELVELAKSGDEGAFGELVEPYRRELHAHCYRILGSVQDAEDALQETLLAAWRGLASFEQRASVRTWLYSIATNRALNMLRAARRRPAPELWMSEVELPEPTRRADPVWLEPYPDVLFQDELGSPPGPEARYEAKEAISLAFVAALQMLPARQRAVLILRDVLGFRAAEVARILGSTVESVTSALKRARATLEGLARPVEPPPPPDSSEERRLIDRLTSAFETSDVDALVALLADDVRLSMPPFPLEYIGREDAARFYAIVVGARHGRRIVQTRANGQPALAVYTRDVTADVHRATSLLVITLAGRRVAEITRFDAGVLERFGLPRILPNEPEP
jgi:RNA polymerase sigma-70 factor (TIGR02960 family)